MAEIELKKRAVYAGDVHIALLKAGWSIREACDFVNRLPKADVAPVVHCEECKYWEQISYGHRTDGICLCLHKYHDAERPGTEGDFYCAYGKLKSGTQPQREDV